MSWEKKFVELDKAIHDRTSFDCSDSELNIFIRTQAAKHMKMGISRTMVLPAAISLPGSKLSICSFYTIAPSSIAREHLPKTMARKLPRYPVPVFLLAQMAVHLKYQDQGLGKITLIKALEYLWEINFHMRAFAVIVDPVNKNAEQFYTKYGFEKLCDHRGKTRLFISMKTIEQLFR